jgi:adenylyl-sulfate kinase
MVRPDEPPTADDPARQRQVLLGQAGRVAWFTGLPSAGKSTIAAAAERELLRQGRLTRILDGDAMRGGLCRDLRYSLADRTENLRRLAEMAALFAETGVITLVAAISPLRAHRAAARAIVGPDRFLEVYVRADVATCERRDPKGNYARARAGLITDFTGIGSPYEEPEQADVVLDTRVLTPDQAVQQLVRTLIAHSQRAGS